LKRYATAGEMADDKIAELKREAEEIKAKIKAEKDAKRDTSLVEYCKGISHSAQTGTSTLNRASRFCN
jgi:hypothetical protein